MFEIDEAKAIEEIKTLSENVRRYLQILWRNQLQSFLAAVEAHHPAPVIMDEVWKMKDDLRRLGL
ncbi:MAG: hypothetical protein HY883_02810 [Deltaproteobacteria bacterium]|nr:hypothetical protein [Deltaproteobacteria bacterium]